MLQFRPLGNPSAAYYSPGRDIAHVGMYFLQDGLDFLKHLVDHKVEYVRDYMQTHNISHTELEEAVADFIKSVEEEIKNPNESMLENNSFKKHRPAVRFLIYSCIAPFFIGATIKGKKDVLFREDIVELSAEEFHQKVTKLADPFKVVRPTLWDVIKKNASDVWVQVTTWIRDLASRFVCQI